MIAGTVLQSTQFSVVTHVCQHPRTDCGGAGMQGGEPARLLLTRCGSFGIRVGDKTCFARPGQAVLVLKDVDYLVTHPDAGGYDCCTDVLIDDEAVEMLGLAGRGSRACRELAHDLHFQKTHVEMLLSLQRCGNDEQEAEEVLLDTLEYLLTAHAAARPRSRNAATNRQVARVEEAILGHTEENVGIQALAELANCSTFHLCRIFRSSTGRSLRQFRMHHRLGTALGRLGEGQNDLAALACETGFSSHSHMTDAFREVLGVSPSQLRDDLKRSDLRSLKLRLRDMRGRKSA